MIREPEPVYLSGGDINTDRFSVDCIILSKGASTCVFSLHLQDNTLFPLRCVIRNGIYSVQELFSDDKAVLEP